MVFIPELRHADRDDRDTLKLRQQLLKGFQRVFQILSVVPPLAKDNLSIQASSGFIVWKEMLIGSRWYRIMRSIS